MSSSIPFRTIIRSRRTIWTSATALPVLMTEKDAVKCRAFADPRLWYVPVAARFGERDAAELLERTLRKLGLTAHARG